MNFKQRKNFLAALSLYHACLATISHPTADGKSSYTCEDYEAVFGRESLVLGVETFFTDEGVVFRKPEWRRTDGTEIYGVIHYDQTGRLKWAGPKKGWVTSADLKECSPIVGEEVTKSVNEVANAVFKAIANTDTWALKKRLQLFQTETSKKEFGIG